MHSFHEYRPTGETNEKNGLRVLLHPNRPRWLVGNGTFGEIAQMLGAGKSRDEVGLILAERYDIVAETALHDVEQVAEQLKAHQFLDTERSSPVRIPQMDSLFVYLTDRCNLSCSHCYHAEKPQRDLPPALYKKLADEMIEMGGNRITVSGGESLLHPDLKELLAHRNGRYAITLLTNGTLLDKEWAIFLAGLADLRVQISIDGSTKEIHESIRGKGTFEKALRAIDCLQQAGLGMKLNLATTIMAQNLPDLPRIIDLAGRLGVPRVRFLPVRRKGRAEEKWGFVGGQIDERGYEHFFDHVLHDRCPGVPRVDVSCGLSGFMLVPGPESPADEIWCPVGRKLVVRPDGETYPCVLMEEEEFALGNVFQEGLARIMGSQGMARTCNILSERKDKIHECASCVWRNFCQAGCMGEALGERGTVWERGRFCEYRRKLYEKAVEKLLNRPVPGEWTL